MANTAIVGSGLGGNRMAIRQLTRAKEYGVLPQGFVSLDTNPPSLNFVERKFKELQIRTDYSRVALAKDGSGFAPNEAESYFLDKRDAVAQALEPYDTVMAFFALGKGTGTGTLAPFVELMIEKGIMPLIVACLPPADSAAYSPQDFEDCYTRLRRVMENNLRICVVDGSVLTTKEFGDFDEEEAWSKLDELTQETLFHCVGRILSDPSDADMTDLSRFLSVAGGGLWVPGYGKLQGEDATTEVSKAWEESLACYYHSGPELQRVFSIRYGKWKQRMISALNSCQRQYSRFPYIDPTAIDTGQQIEPPKANVANSFRIIESRVEDFDGYAFACLRVTSPHELYTAENARQFTGHNWKWQSEGRGTKPAVSFAQAASAEPLSPSVLCENVFRTTDPAQITFAAIARSANSYESVPARMLLAGTMENCLDAGSRAKSHLGATATFYPDAVDILRSLQDLAELAKDPGCISDDVQTFLATQLVQEGFAIPADLQLSSTNHPDNKFVLDMVNRAKAEGFKAMQAWEFDPPEDRQLVKTIRRLLVVLPKTFALLVRPANEGKVAALKQACHALIRQAAQPSSSAQAA